MKTKICYLSALILTFATFANAILIEVNRNKKQKYCFSKYVETGDVIEASYVVSGEQEDLVDAVLFHENTLILQKHGHEAGDFKHNATGASKQNLKFRRRLQFVLHSSDAEPLLYFLRVLHSLRERPHFEHGERR